MIDWIEQRFDINYLTLFTIGLFSTPVARVLVALIVSAALVFILLATCRSKPALRFGLRVIGATAVLVACHFALDLRVRFAALIFVVLAVNWAPREWTARAPSAGIKDKAVALLPVVPELLLGRDYIAWVARLARRPFTWTNFSEGAPGAAIAAAAIAVLVASPGAFTIPTTLTQLEQRMRSSDASRQFAVGNFNALALSPDGRYLFATGHGVDRVVRFDTTDVEHPPLAADQPIGGAQSLAFAPAWNEVSVIHRGRVQVLDAATMTTRRTFSLGAALSPGDSWIVQDRHTGSMIIASEADEHAGWSMLVLDRVTGEVRTRLQEPAGNLLLHPTEPRIYLSFFRDLQGGAVRAYGLDPLKVVAIYKGAERTDRMAFDRKRDLLLVTEPTAARIIQLDADTLRRVGELGSIFGVRVIAVDDQRDVILVGSLATGMVTMQALATGQRLRSWYIGPWLRSIELDARRGIAFISSNGGLFELRYADGLSNPSTLTVG